MKSHLLVIAAFIFYYNNSYSQSKNELVIKSHNIESEIIQGEEYLIDVILPPGYDSDRNDKYPVVYFLDFWMYKELLIGIDKILHLAQEIEPIIIIGLNQNVDLKGFVKNRTRDLTPIENRADSTLDEVFPSGGALKFLNFIKNELEPFVNQSYNVDNLNTTIIGHSYGGLFLTWLLTERPESFNNYLIGSPALWWDNFSIYKNIQVAGNKLGKNKIDIFIGSGGNEPEKIKESHKYLIDFFNNSEFPGITVKSEYFSQESHMSVNPVLYTRGLKYFFGH